MTKILVTGSKGFIGSHLMRRFPKAIHFDLEERLFYDVTNPLAVEKFWRENEPDVVVHLAANANPTMASWSCLQDAEVNILGTINVLEASLKRDVELLIYASSAHVGGGSSLPIRERRVCDPKNPYAISKYVGELYCRYYAQHGFPVTILRFFNVYGPNQPKGFVIPDLLERVYYTPEKSGIVNVLGPSDDSRDYIYVADVVEAINKTIVKKVHNEIINIGSGVEITTEKLCRIIADELGKNVQFKYLDRPLGQEPSTFQAHIAKAKSLLGWKLTVGLREGIKKTAKNKGFL